MSEAATKAPRTSRDPELLKRRAAQARLRRAAQQAKIAQTEQAQRKLAGEPEPTPPSADAPVVAAPGESAPAQAEQAGPSAADVAAFVEPCKGIWTSASAVLEDDPLWKLKPAEIDMLAEASAPVAAKYLPSMLASPEAQLAAAILMVFGPRLIAARRRAAPGPSGEVRAGAVPTQTMEGGA